MGSVLKVMKAGKATKNTLASFESLNALLKASDSGAATQIKPHAHELVDIYVALISRHAETKKMYVCIRPHSSSPSPCFKLISLQHRAEIALRSLGYFTYNSVAVSQLNGRSPVLGGTVSTPHSQSHGFAELYSFVCGADAEAQSERILKVVLDVITTSEVKVPLPLSPND